MKIITCDHAARSSARVNGKDVYLCDDCTILVRAVVGPAEEPWPERVRLRRYTTDDTPAFAVTGLVEVMGENTGHPFCTYVRDDLHADGERQGWNAALETSGVMVRGAADKLWADGSKDEATAIHRVAARMAELKR